MSGDELKRYILDLPTTVLPLPEASGIYFLIEDGKIVYIGQSIRVFLRLAVHQIHGKKKWDLAKVEVLDPKDLGKREQEYIQLLLPRYNNESQTRAARYRLTGKMYAEGITPE